MSRRILFIVLWTLGFAFGTAVLLAFMSGFYFMLTASPQEEPSESLVSKIGTAWVIGPMIMAPIGLLLGIFGRLPGTRARRKRRHMS